MGFSSYLGDDYSGVWTSYTTVKITLVDVTHAAAEELTRVGVLRLTVKMLQSADESSPVSTSTGVLGGSWLAHSAPVVVSCNASDDGNQEGIGNGDVITVVFDQETNSPAITTKADIDGIFNFTDPDGSEVSMGADYTGAYAWDVLTGSVSVVTGSAVVSTSADVRSTLDRGDEVKIDGVVYRVSLSGVYNASHVSLDSAYGGSSSSSVQAYRRSRSTMLITIVDVCDQVMIGLGLDVLADGSSSCNDTAPYKNTRVNSAQWGNGMSLTVKASGDLTSEDRSSNVSTATSTLSGTWGDHAAPAIVSTTASAAGNASGLNTGDKITIVFDRHTNVPGVSTKSDVDTVFAFGSSLGTTYTGVWLSLSVLELELTNVYNRFDDDHTSLNFADISSTAPAQDTAVGTLSVTVKASGYLQSADLSSVHSTSSDVLIGSWGDHSAPEIVSVTASEGGVSESGIGAGDTITIVFDKQTTLQAVDTKIGVDELFMFSSYLGDDYSGVWTSYTTVKITLVDVTHAAAEELTRVGVLRLTVKMLQSADESSPVSTSTGVLGGSWLAHSAPVIVSCNASDDGNQEGIGNGDVITVVFDQETNSPAITTKADIDGIFNFTDPDGSEVSMGADYTGEYAWEPLDATVAVTNGDVEVGCAVDLSTSIFVGDEIKIGGVVYKVAATPTPSPTPFPC